MADFERSRKITVHLTVNDETYTRIANDLWARLHDDVDTLSVDASADIEALNADWDQRYAQVDPWSIHQIDHGPARTDWP